MEKTKQILKNVKLVCKGCNKEITISNSIGSELLAVTSVIGHIVTCKELKDKAEGQSEGLKEFIKIFFELKEN